MSRPSVLTLLLAVLSLVFFLLLVFLRTPFPLEPLVSYQDALDLLTPLVLIPLYWLLFQAAAATPARRAEEIAFMVLAGVWVLGHGMHLAANSINNLIGAVPPGSTPVEVSDLVHLYDEVLSHYVWHIGVIGLALLLIYREWRGPHEVPTTGWMALLGGVIYGFTLFSVFLEGQTVVLGLPFVAGVVLFALTQRRGMASRRPVLAFFAISSAVALLLFTGWGLYWGGFPQFSDVGLI